LRIAVNTRFLIKDKLEGIGRFTFETLKIIVNNNPEVEFIFCFDRPFHPDFIFANNITPIIINPPARHAFLWHIWFQYSLPKVLKPLNIDVFLSPDGFIPLNAPFKTVAVIHDLAFEHFPRGVDWISQQYYKYFFPRFAKKASQLITVSEFTKQDIIKQYQINESKIEVVYDGVSESFKPIDNLEKEKTIQALTGGTKYFVCIGAIHPRKNIITLLKAFEDYCLKQKNPYKLVIIGRKGWKNIALENYLRQMKSKDDVIFTGKLNDNNLITILASAKATIYPSVFEGFGLPVLEAMACGVPIVTTHNSAMQEIAIEAAFFFSATQEKELSQILQSFENDEELLKNKIEKGLQIAQKYTWENTANLLWQSIIKTIN
jgi:glycosyltransferase involved in cell wall biosynthesis